MSNLVSYIEKLPTVMKNFKISSLKQHLDMLELVKSTSYETEQVMGYLKYKKDSWAVLQEGIHPWYFTAKQGADTLLRNCLPDGQPIFLLHLESRWLLIMVEGKVVPAIFLFTDLARDGISVSFYRIFGGAALSTEWMDMMNELVSGVISFHAVEQLPEAVLPFDEMYRFSL